MTQSIGWSLTLAIGLSLALPMTRQASAQTEPSIPDSVIPSAPASSTSGATSATPAVQPTSEQNSSLEAQVTPPGEAIAQCPGNQFASVFSDVLPSDWAYEAVNRLAIGQVQCFPLPSER